MGIALFVLMKARSPWEEGEKRFLVWTLAVGWIVNLLPIRWFDKGGTIEENLHAWVMVLAAIMARGLSRLPRPAIAALVVAMIAEYGMVDVRSIRRQMVALPLANHPSAIEGCLPLGVVLPDPIPSAAFRTDSIYYRNYQFKIEGGALYFRDLHPGSYEFVAWSMLAIGALGLAAGQRRSHGRGGTACLAPAP